MFRFKLLVIYIFDKHMNSRQPDRYYAYDSLSMIQLCGNSYIFRTADGIDRQRNEVERGNRHPDPYIINTRSVNQECIRLEH